MLRPRSPDREFDRGQTDVDLDATEAVLPLLVMTWRSYRNIVGFVGCGAAQAASIAGASHGGYYPR